MPRTLRPEVVFPITTRTLQVLRAHDVTPGMRRVTLGGDGLGAHTAPSGYPVAGFRSDGFDDEFKLFFRHPDLDEPLVPTQADGILNWPRDPKLIVRTYTVRRWDPSAGELDVDVVQHGAGPATTCANQVRPGEEIHIAGPKMSARHPEGADWVLIAGDETALPAIGRWLEEFPAGARAQVFIEIAEDAHRQDLSTRDDVQVTWLSRNGAEAGTTTLLFDAIQAADWWPGVVFAWAAGEALSMTPIRRWLRNEKGLGKQQVDVTGYWRRTPDHGVAEPGLPDREEPSAAARLHELTEVLPPEAIRVAVTLGIPEVLASGPLPGDALARLVGADPHALTRLLRYLAEIDVVRRHDDGWALTSVGQELLQDHVAEPLHLGGVQAARERALSGLCDAIRAGVSPYAGVHGRPFDEMIAQDGVLQADAVEVAHGRAGWVSSAVAHEDAFAGLGTLYVHGPGAGEISTALTRRHPALRTTVLAAPSQIAAMRKLLGDAERVQFEAGSALRRTERTADAFLFAEALTPMPDEDAIHALARAAESVTDARVLVLDHPLDAAEAGEHDYEEDLLHLVTTGGALRTYDQFTELFDRAGLTVRERRSIGWGASLFILCSG